MNVVNPDAYIQWACNRGPDLASKRTVANLVLFLDGRPLAGDYPVTQGDPVTSGPISMADDKPAVTVPIYPLTFRLVRTSKNNDTWAELLDRPNAVDREVTVSVGFEDLTQVASNIKKGDNGHDLNPNAARFRLIVVPFNVWMMGGILLIIASLWIFLRMVGKTELLRDPQAPLKPDRRRPFSLARTQMAFWFFLVFSTYFLIWVVTDDKDSIPGSVLGLIGISAATAIGSSVVDSNRVTEEERSQDEWIDLRSGGPRLVYKNLKSREKQLASDMDQIREQIERQKQDSGHLGEKTPEELQKELTDKSSQLDRIEPIRKYFGREPWRVFAYDILSDQDVISFSRFQIVVWTLLLGIIFLKEVYTNLAMPDFSPGLLGLMGISAGTFVGLKTAAKAGSAPGK